MRILRAISAVGAFAWLAMNATHARAEERSAAQAADLFVRGRDAMKRSEYATACAAFAESQKLDPSPGTLLNLAVCEERLGHLLRARDHVREFIRSVPPTDDRGPRAVALAAHLDERIPTVIIELPADLPTETQVLLDDAELARDKWHTTLPVEPGEHAVVLKTPGRADWRQQLTLAEGEKITVTPPPLPALETPPAAAEPLVFTPTSSTAPLTAERQSSPLPPVFWASAAVGAVGIGMAATSGILALVNRNALDDHCEQKRCDAEGLAAAERGEMWATVNTVTLPVGILGTALATYLFVSRPKAQPAIPVQVSVHPRSPMVFVGSAF